MTEIRLAYASRARIPTGSEDMRAIEAASLRNNTRLGVTGGLYYDGEQFFQVLEGPENAVAILFDWIRKDPRHDELQLICRHPIKQRMFRLWSMKLVDGSAHPELRADFEAAAALASPSGHAIDPRIEVLRRA